MHQKHCLSNGIRLVTEYIPHVKSVSIGFWVESGSIYEGIENNGITHFIEHMLFKGTAQRTAKDIAESIDNIGGQLNAFTGKECTCYYAKVLDAHLHIAVDVLTDMLFNSIFSPPEIEKEKSIIIEEINMYEDSPEDLVHDLISKIVFMNNPLGLPILGSHETVKSFTREDLVHYIENNYTTDNIVISVAGHFNTEELIIMLEDKLKSLKNLKQRNNTSLIPSFTVNNSVKIKDTEQLHLCIGLEGVSAASRYLYPLLLMNNVFGGSMSSRLFQNIREDKGLAYSVFSYPSTYKSQGLFTIYLAINPTQVNDACKHILEEINIIKKHGLSEDELHKSKEQLKGNYILGLESTSSRMTSIGRSELLLNKIYSQKDIINKIDSVTIEEVNDVIQQVFNMDKSSIAVVGKPEADIKFDTLLKN